MKKYLLILSLFISFFYTSTIQGQTQEVADEKPYVIMVSFDGFRWNYTNRVPTPNFDRIASKGVRGTVQSSFPTKTFPNHYTIATGLYPDHHGIVNNSFFDPKRNEEYSISNREKVGDGTFYGGEPIWNTAEKQGIKSASYFWVGSEANVQGMHPSIWKKYDESFPWRQRVDSVIGWLQYPNDKRPHLILWYISEPDGVGHDFGPESKETDLMIMRLDSLLGYFLDELEKANLNSKVNVIVTSDHGMEEIKKERFIILANYLKQEWYNEVIGGNPVYNIWSKEGFKDSIYNALSKVEHLKIYSKANIPERLNYMQNERCGDFVVVADSSYALTYKRIPQITTGGTHGYDNANTNMDVIFYAFGPAFKENYKASKFQNVDIYNLVAKILKLKPAPNDGDTEAFETLKP